MKKARGYEWGFRGVREYKGSIPFDNSDARGEHLVGLPHPEQLLAVERER